MIFEGLCRRWGFYIPCSWGRDRLGSVDMQRCLQMDQSIAYSFQRYPPWDDNDVAQNVEAARVAFSRVFLSRLTIFKIFLDELDDKKSSDAQMRWLLFQALTRQLEPYDIFDKVTAAVSRVSEFYMKDMIADLLLDVKARLDGSETELFCIVDNCERASNLYDDKAFGLGTTFLRELVRTAEKYDGVTVILSGSNIDVGAFQNACPSRYTLYTHTGALLTQDAQRAYMGKYLPHSLVKSVDGKKLLNLSWRWLRGRYVIISRSSA